MAKWRFREPRGSATPLQKQTFLLPIRVMSASGKTYSGPPSDHFDGRQFFAPGWCAPQKAERGSALAVWRPPPAAGLAKMGAEPARRYAPGARRGRQGAVVVCRPRQLADPDREPQHPDRSRVVGAGLAVRWAGPKRRNDPGIAFDALPPIDVVLVSHGHYDHLDIATLSGLAAEFSRAWSRRSATT